MTDSVSETAAVAAVSAFTVEDELLTAEEEPHAVIKIIAAVKIAKACFFNFITFFPCNAPL